jgi:HEAT repeat protein
VSFIKRCMIATICLALACYATSLAYAEEANDELVDLVVGLLADEDKDIRALGLEQVRTAAEGASVTIKFAEQLAKIGPEGQVALLRALADRGDAAARPQILAMIDETKTPAVRVAAIKSLSRLGLPDDAPRLVKLLTDESKQAQAAARKSLTDLAGKDVSGDIAVMLATATTTPLCVSLIEILADRRAFETSPTLVDLVTNDDVAVRAAAMKALSELATPEHVTSMVDGVLKAADSRERATAEKCVMIACARVADPEARADPILKAMEDLDEAQRITLLSTLGRVGGSKSLAIIEQAIRSENERTHDIGIRALCNWPDASVATRLMELSQKEEHASHKIATLRALIRVAPLRDDRSDADRLQILAKAMEMATRDDERNLALDRAREIRTIESLRFVLPYTDQPAQGEQACLSIVELAHHRGLREPHHEEFHKALDKVIATSKNATVIDRAKRYKKGETWVRPQ